MSRATAHRFTLMEIMVAATILSMSVAAILGILGSARSSLLRSKDRWNWQHQLTQATEAYLLGGPNVTMPDGLLQEGVSVSCELSEVEDIHEEALEHVHQWMLGEYHIVLRDREGRIKGENWVQKLIKEDDLE